MTDEGPSTGSGPVRPQTLKGFQDLLPQDAILQNHVVGKAREVLERFGFLPIDTPALESLSVLTGTGGEETNKEIFSLESPEAEPIALRFDLTVPFARYLAQYRDELKLPFRRYHFGAAWRADKPGPGRFRQFSQLDFDAAGSASMAVDAEIVQVMCEVLDAVGVEGYVVTANHRKLVDALLLGCGIADEGQHKHVLRVVDKLAKVGIDNVVKELGEGRIDESGDPIRGVGLDAASIGAIERFLAVTGDSRAAVLDGVRAMLPAGDATSQAVGETQAFLDALDQLGVAEARVQLTPSLARGLDYYTGPVYEAILPAAPRFGSLAGGGRYDGLVSRFGGDEIPATGGSIGISRFLAILEEIGAVEPMTTTTEVLVTVMDADLMPHYLSIAADLRRAGVNTEVYFGGPTDRFRDQMSLANRRGLRLAIILGGDEAEAGTVAIKDLQAGKAGRQEVADRQQYVKLGKTGQVTVPRDQCVHTVLQLLGRAEA